MDTHPDGKVWASREEEKEDPLMYSLSAPYTEIKPVRAALSSFAVQKCANKLTAEASKSDQPTTAFSVHASSKENSQHKLEWQEIGISTVETVQALLRVHMPLAFGFMLKGRKCKLSRPGSVLE
jgi:hypothetical protein